jgi:predicted nuclease with TOPRIM domain
MFGNKALKEEVLHYKQKSERIEKESWDLYRDNAQLERDKTNLEKALYAHKDTITELKKEKKRLEEENDRIDTDRLNLTKDYMELQNKKPTKDELIEQLAELLLNENRGTEKGNLINQMNLALRINDNPVIEGDVQPQWNNPQQ